MTAASRVAAFTRRHVPGRCAVESPRTVAFRFGPLAAKCQLASAEVAMPTRTVSSGLLNVARRRAPQRRSDCPVAPIRGVCLGQPRWPQPAESRSPASGSRDASNSSRAAQIGAAETAAPRPMRNRGRRPARPPALAERQSVASRSLPWRPFYESPAGTVGGVTVRVGVGRGRRVRASRGR